MKMPKGQYDRATHNKRVRKEEIKAFIRFCFRDDIAKRLESAKKPHILAAELYEHETGRHISPQTALKQYGKWTMVNDIIYEIKEGSNLMQEILFGGTGNDNSLSSTSDDASLSTFDNTDDNHQEDNTAL